MARPREMWLEEEFRARPREAGGWREVGKSAGGAVIRIVLVNAPLRVRVKRRLEEERCRLLKVSLRQPTSLRSYRLLII